MNKADMNLRPTGDPSRFPQCSKEGVFVILHKVRFNVLSSAVNK